MNSSINRLNETFIKMKADGFNTSHELKWGFYFIDNSKDTLQNIYDELKGNNYSLEEIRKINEDEFLLHVSKVDTLTPEKLHKRNLAFNELAAYYSAIGYDGWDVEKLKN